MKNWSRLVVTAIATEGNRFPQVSVRSAHNMIFERPVAVQLLPEQVRKPDATRLLNFSRQPPPYARTQCCHTDRQCRTPMPSVCPQLTTASLACPPPQPTHTVLVSTITLTLLVTTTMICTELRDDANVSDFTSPPSPSHFQPQPSPTTTCMHRVGEYYHIHPLDGASTTTLSPLLQHTNDSDGNHRHTSMMTAAVAFGHHLNHHDDHQQHNGYP